MTSVSVRSRSYFSILHLQAAAFFARCSAAIEHANTGEHSRSARSQHKCYVVGSVITSVASLEAMINEIFSDSSERYSEYLADLPDNIRTRFARMWAEGIPRTARYSILNKYQIALTLAEKEMLDASAAIVQNVTALVALRNQFVHYEPEWILDHTTEGAQKEKHRFEKLLAGRFPLNPLTGRDNPFYPDKVLGHGCAAWAVASTISFAEEFCARLGVLPTFVHVPHTLSTS
jgi:hypothetical protein